MDAITSDPPPAVWFKIEASGIYQLDGATYHADPCPTQSLSSSGAHTLAMKNPAAFVAERATRIYSTHFDIGNAAHYIMLEPDKFDAETVVIRDQVTKDGRPSTGYVTADAKERRRIARESGKVPLLEAQFDMIRRMRDAMHADPIGRFAFRDGKPEQSIFWQDEEFGCWCRTRPDWLPDNMVHVINYKTCASVEDDDLEKILWTAGYFQKAAWELDGIEAVTGIRPEKFCLLCQEKAPPFAVRPVWIKPEALQWGGVLNRYARGVFAWCRKYNEWPAYRPPGPPTAVEKGLPAYAYHRLTERQLAGDFSPP